MKLVKWEPKREWDLFRELMDFEKEAEGLFLFPLTLSKKPGAPGLVGGWKWSPKIDIIDHPKEVVVKAELPGVKKEDVDIRIDGDYLTIRGEKREEKEHKGKKFHRKEAFYGSFEKGVTLPAFVDDAKADAEFKEGVLHIKLPKKEGRKERQVKIHVK